MFNFIGISFVIFLKFVLPIAIAFFPFAAGWANFILDTIDGDILIPLGLTDSAYQLIDKIADWVTYAGMIFAAWRCRWNIRRWIYGLFAFRSIGQLAFFLFRNERLFFYFPNFLEPLFLIYATIFFFKKAESYNFYLKYKWAIWIFVILYKMQDEYLTHMVNIDRSDFIRGLFNKIF